MPTKRRNGGRAKHGRGHVNPVRCSNCGRSCPKDKAIKRFSVRNIVDASSQRDLREASAYHSKLYQSIYIYIYMLFILHASTARCMYVCVLFFMFVMRIYLRLRVRIALSSNRRKKK